MPTSLDRRSLFQLALIAGCGAASAGCSRTPLTTVVVAPHPDDETLRLTSFALSRRDEGEAVMLVAATDGGSSRSPLALKLGRERLMPLRIKEQQAAWSHLTGGRGRIVRLGLPDGSVRAQDVIDRLAPILAPLQGVRLVAAAHDDDLHPDHREVAGAVRAIPIAVPHERWTALPAGTESGGEVFECPDALAARAADAAYAPFGHQSVADLFLDLRRTNYTSRLSS